MLDTAALPLARWCQHHCQHAINSITCYYLFNTIIECRTHTHTCCC